MIEIKVCGITKEEEIEYINEAEVNYAGFVFYEKSKRNISIEDAEKISMGLRQSIKRVAVMVSPDIAFINRLNNMRFDIYQIHKELSLDVIDKADKPIWLAVNVDNTDDLAERINWINELSESRRDKIEAIVVDSSNFGSGKTFDWKKSKRLKKAGTLSPPNIRFVLAGGLNSENVNEGISLFEPDIVDVSSSVEGDNGKDRLKITKFVKAVRKNL